MKVTVCFGSTRVIVPCGRGEIFVKDLIQQAITRYKKATGKSSNSWVTVYSLQSQDGGILDPDDRLKDVADDREQIIAFYDDDDKNIINSFGDGTSFTPSPEIFCSRDGIQTDIEVTNKQIACGFSDLHVRRGSESALIPFLPEYNNLEKCNNNVVVSAGQRWSAAPMVQDLKEKFQADNLMKINAFGLTHNERLSEGENNNDLNIDEKENPLVTKQFLTSPFHRDSSNRLSIQFSGESSGDFRWPDDLANNRTLSLSLPRERNHKRKEPLGQAHSNFSNSLESQKTEFIVLNMDSGPLGIHVVPDYNSLGKECGLLVQGIEPGGRVYSDGKLQINDRIIEINGRSLFNQPFNVIQEIFRDSLHSNKLTLKIINNKNNMDVQTSHNTMIKKTQIPSSGFPFSNKENFTPEPVNVHCKSNSNSRIMPPTKKVIFTNSPASNILTVANTKKIGRKFEFHLTKSIHGLGFSITTRDNPTGGNCPIYIKNVLPKGAAVVDGRLKSGDRLLTVNDIELVGKSQTEVVKILKNIPSGTEVKIVVSRQEDINQTAEKCIQENDEKMNENDGKLSENRVIESDGTSTDIDILDFIKNEAQKFSLSNKDILSFNIPVHDSEKAGLGISVKGKTSSSNSHDKNIPEDLGIFIKNVFYGGAASRDSRLCTNDQLLCINGISLIGQSNASAMETLRKTMINADLGLVRPRVISLIVGRQRCNSPKLCKQCSPDSSSSVLTDSSANTETFEFVDDVNIKNQNSDRFAFHNPVLDKLTGSCRLRNKSYYKATNQSTLIIEDMPNYNFISREKKQDKPMILLSSLQAKSETARTDMSFSSQLSLDNANFLFSRNGIGRQSLSEKRHASLDAKNTDTYKKNKCRKGFYSKHQLGPSLGMKKSSSLESLQTMVQEVKLLDHKTKHGHLRNLHNKICDQDLKVTIDAIHLNELESETYGEKNDYHQIGHRQTSLCSQIDNRAQTTPPLLVNKKKSSLLKGFGFMFRFNKPRRELDLVQTNNREDDFERELAKKSAINEQLRIREQYKKLIQRQTEEENIIITSGKISTESLNTSRLDQIQQLRIEHQRRYMKHCQPIDQINRNPPKNHVDIINSTRFNHYVNFQEIQQNLNRRHFQYHSQRPKGSMTRPSSNYYEYESVMKSLPYTDHNEKSHMVDDNFNPMNRQVVGGGSRNMFPRIMSHRGSMDKKTTPHNA